MRSLAASAVTGGIPSAQLLSRVARSAPVLALAGGIVFTSSAHAAQILVDTNQVAAAADGQCSLVEAINAANLDAAQDACRAGAGADTIVLPTGTMVISAVHNTVDGMNGLPSVTSNITIRGSNSTIRNLTPVEDPQPRLLHVDTDGILAVENTALVAGHASGAAPGANLGGAVLNRGSLILRNSTVRNNFANLAGGGVYSLSGSLLTIANSTISSNTATNTGGGIEVASGASASLTNTTVSGNDASEGDGVRNAGTLNISFSTIAQNLGVGLSNAGDVSATGALIAGNDGAACSQGVGSMIDTSFVNFADDSTCSGFENNLFASNLLSLADNGGGTETHLLGPFNPAVDGGSFGCYDGVGADQRGIVRAQDADNDSTLDCDVGAVELLADQDADGLADYLDNLPDDPSNDCGDGTTVAISRGAVSYSTFANQCAAVDSVVLGFGEIDNAIEILSGASLSVHSSTVELNHFFRVEQGGIFRVSPYSR